MDLRISVPKTTILTVHAHRKCRFSTFGLGSYIILEIALHSQVEYPQPPAVHCVFIPLIISSHLLTWLDHFLEFVERLENSRSVPVPIGQVCHKIRSSGVKYKNQSKILRSKLLDQDCDSCLKTADFNNDVRTQPRVLNNIQLGHVHYCMTAVRLEYIWSHMTWL